jgi:tellurite resistance protein
MMNTLQSPDTSHPDISHPDMSHQTTVWLRGLLTVAWADGELALEEQTLIATLTHHDLNESEKSQFLTPVSPAELAAALKPDPLLAENFLRMAVMVALVDRSYSQSEDTLLHDYCQALELNPEALDLLRTTLSDLSHEAQAMASDLTPDSEPVDPKFLMTQSSNSSLQTSSPIQAGSLLQPDSQPSVLDPVRTWLDKMDIHDPKIAHFLCKMIPPQCPFERDVVLFGRKIAHIPAMCKLNPLYEQLVGLRFRALCYLADDCGEDVAPYC